MPQPHDAVYIMLVDLIGGIRRHDVASASKLHASKAVARNFIDGERKFGVEKRHLFGVGQIHHVLLLTDFAEVDALPAIYPRGDGSPVELSLCLVANLPFILVTNQHRPAKWLPDCGLSLG